MSACVKLAGDLPNFQKVFFRNLVSATIALYLIIKHKGSFTGKKENIESALDVISTIVSKAMERKVMQNEVISTSGRSTEAN